MVTGAAFDAKRPRACAARDQVCAAGRRFETQAAYAARSNSKSPHQYQGQVAGTIAAVVLPEL